LKTKESPFTVATAQLAPVFLDREKTIGKVCEAIAEAATAGAKVIVFPEAFVPAYPDWVWVIPPGREKLHRELYSELLDQSVAVPSAATEKIGRAAKAAGAYVVVGVNERNVEASGGSIYNTLLFFDDKGALMGRHRKLIPTAAERMVWTPGDGSTLEVFDTPYGKLGGLICWENYMPLARYALYAWGVQIYVAATWDCADTWVATLQHIAKEGRCTVIGSCIAMKVADVPDRYEFKELYPDPDGWMNAGNSGIVSAHGHFVAGPAEREETILYAEIDPADQRGMKYWNDVAGHYARPDVFQLTVNRTPNAMLNVAGGETSANGTSPAKKPRRKVNK